MALKVLLLLILVFSHHADSGSIVKFLPGFEGPLPFELETGYIGIGEEENLQLFYYFIKSEKNPKEDPLLLWLNGGPGCSSLEGLLFENGLVAVKVEVYNGSLVSLVSTTYSWTQMANIIYLDQPIGAGFSYSRTPLGKTSDTNEAKMIHEFLQKGYVLGNPVTYPEFEENYRIPFSHGMSLISDELHESLKINCKGNYGNVDPRNTKCLKLVEEYHKCTDKINTQHILLPDCDDKRNPKNTSPDCYYYLYYIIECWANNERVREALHVKKGTKGHWQRCNWTIPYDHDIISSVPYHMNISLSGYRSLVYSGDHDITMPFLGTQAWIKSLNYSIIDDWRPWKIKDQIAGYTRTYSNKMTFATIKGGGHTAEYKPNETFIMFQRWISGHPL
ncbi:serine carboxypeptidase-like 10 isoform X2 [Brassica rapa]|uniref:serine carboxypeptidase-like 10 isoform X2 n=1 Tax=Brassica campestris TaxID=3711 RepID=UPI00142D2970|nr:serine carboxypeptidase-like 10 isoform X2 [Brassica rapa]